MALTFDWANLIVQSDASITDLPAFHALLREAEDDAIGMIYPVIHTWKALNLGSGAYFYQADFVNGWTLKFTPAGNYTINGNLNATIVPVAGVYVERKTSAAFATSGTTASSGGVDLNALAAAVWTYTTRTLTAGGGSVPTVEEIATAILSAAQATPIHADTKKMNGATVLGDGTSGNLWRGE